MFSKEYFEILKELLASWQVIAATVAIIFFFHIVSHVARSYHPKRATKKLFKKRKSEVQTAGNPDPKDAPVATDSDEVIQED